MSTSIGKVNEAGDLCSMRPFLPATAHLNRNRRPTFDWLKREEERTIQEDRGCARDACSSSPFLLPVRIFQPLGHLLVLRGHARPTLCRSVPAIVPDGEVDAAVDQEL